MEKTAYRSVRFDRETRDSLRVPEEIFAPMLRDGDISLIEMPHPKKPDKKQMFFIFSVRAHKVRDYAATMGPRVIEKVAQGSRYHIGLMNEWQPVSA